MEDLLGAFLFMLLLYHMLSVTEMSAYMCKFIGYIKVLLTNQVGEAFANY